MYRHIEKDLVDWKNSANRMPLLIRGARQIGKTHTVKEFGSRNFNKLVVVDFEKKPQLFDVFEADLNPREIVEKLELAMGQPIKLPNTLLFFDEIQRCPRAIMALRYFREEWPELPVIAAGSLLDLAFSEISMPVGRVNFLYMYPLSFSEFLLSLGETVLVEYLQHNWISDLTIHAKMKSLLKKYAIVGGMPQAVKTYIQNQSFLDVALVHADLLESFKSDFGKYAKKIPEHHLLRCMAQLPRFVGQQVKYSKIDPDVRSRELKIALSFLTKARLIHKVLATSGAGLPLGAMADESVFKTIFLDVGLMQSQCGIDWKQIPDHEDFLAINQGALAEQFVGQELLANSPPRQDANLYFWKRENQGQAEIDFVIPYKGAVSPIEVKSSSAGRLKSLHFFCSQYQPKQAFVLSTHPYAVRDNITWIPLYGIKRFLSEMSEGVL